MGSFDFRSCDKVAVIGGAFDPIHYGHLAAAQTVYENFYVDRVVLMPLGDAPHKNMSSTTADERFKMVMAAVSDNPAFAVSDMEIRRSGKTYTVDTVEQIKSINPNIDIYFVMGADELESIDTWRQPQKIFSLCRVIAVSRPGYNTEGLIRKIDEVKKKYKGEAYFLEIPSLDISSSDLRKKIKDGKSVKYLMPKEAEKYIIEHDLYKEG